MGSLVLGLLDSLRGWRWVGCSGCSGGVKRGLGKATMGFLQKFISVVS